MLVGLSSNGEFSDFALVGDHLSISATVDGVPDTPGRWSAISFGGTDLGDSTVNPSDFAAADSGDPDAPATLYYQDPVSGKIATVSIRAAAPVNNTPPAIVNSDPTGSDLGDTITMTAGDWTGAASVVQRLFSAGELLAPNGEGVAASHVISEAEDGEAITGEEVAVSSGGSVTVAATGGFTVDDFEAADLSDDVAITGTAEVGQTFGHTGGTPDGNPTPTVTYAWRLVSDDSLVGTTSTLAIISAWVGDRVYLEKSADNGIGGGVTRTSAVSAVIEEASLPTLTINSIGPQQSSGNVPVDYTLTGATSQLYDLVLYDPADGDPTSASQFNGGDADYTDIGQATLDDSGSGVINVLSPWSGNARIAFLPVGGDDEDIVVSPTFSIGISFGTATYTRGTAGVAPEFDIADAVATGFSGGTFTLHIGIYTSATSDDADDIVDETGDAAEYFSIGPETNIADLAPAGSPVPIDLSTTLDGDAVDAIRFVFEHSGGTQSEIGVVTMVNYDAVAPTFSSGSPADNATDVAIDVTPALTFDKNIYGVVDGEVYLYEDIDGTPTLVETFTFSNATTLAGDDGGSGSVSGAVLTLTPGNDLANSEAHSVRWEAGAFVNIDAEPVAANTGDTLYNFTTVASGGSLIYEEDYASAGESANWTPHATITITENTSLAQSFTTLGSQDGALIFTGTDVFRNADGPIITGITPGNDYDFTSAVYLVKNSTFTSVIWRIRWLDAGDSELSTNDIYNQNVGEKDEQIVDGTSQFTAPASAVKVQMRVRVANWTAGVSFRLHYLKIEEV